MISSRTRDWLSRTDVRLALFGVVAVASVFAGFIAIPPEAASTLIKRGGYYAILALFLLFIVSLWRLWRDPAEKLQCGRREALVAGAVIALFSVVAVTNETFRSKVLYDEFVLQSTAYNMHFFRDVAAMVRGYEILGTFVSLDSYLDKRPYFYPFLISVVHDLTGYRPANAYILNAMLLPVALGIAYYLGRLMGGWRCGLLAIALLGSLPVLAQNATGSGMELVNVTMLLLSVALGANYLAAPSGVRLSAFILAVSLLAQCRYESALYVLPGALVVLAGWWRSRTVILSWAAILSPLFLVPVALHHKVLANSPILWEMKGDQTSRFGLQYLPGNLKAAVSYLFSVAHEQSNSIWLAIIGIVAAAWIAVHYARRPISPSRMQPAHLAWLIFAGAILANTALAMSYFWSSYMDPMASRFSLPLFLLLAFCAIAFAAWLDRRGPATVAFLILTGAYFVGISIPKQAQHAYSHLGIDEVEWERRLVSRMPPGDRLVVTNKSTLPWLMDQRPSILIDRARLLSDRLQHQLAQGPYHDIIVIQTLKPTTANVDFAVVWDERLPGFELELIAEKRFGTRMNRISRLVAINAPEAGSSVE
jgi:hypothetical protein